MNKWLLPITIGLSLVTFIESILIANSFSLVLILITCLLVIVGTFITKNLLLVREYKKNRIFIISFFMIFTCMVIYGFSYLVSPMSLKKGLNFTDAILFLTLSLILPIITELATQKKS